MRRFCIIINSDKEYVQEAQVFIKAYLEVEGTECLLYRTPGRTRGAAHIDGAQVPEDTECVTTIGGGGILIQVARDLTGRSIPMLGVNGGHPRYLNQASHQGDTAPVLESLLSERYQLERRMIIHRTAWWRGEILLKDITLNEITITRKDPLEVLRYSVYVNDGYLNEYTIGGVLVAMPTGSTVYNLSVGEPVVAPGARMMVLTPICSHSLDTRSIALVPEDRVGIRVFGSSQVVSSDGDTFTKLEAEDCIDIRHSEPQIVMIKVRQISFMQNLSNHLGGIQTSRSAERYKSIRREASHMKTERHSKIVELVGKYEIETQEGLTEKPNGAGSSTTQTAVPKDIRELKLTKMQSESGRQRYMVLENPRGTPAVRYIRILKDGCMSMDMAQNILVIRTVSGMTTAVVAAPDTIQFRETAGCIAGDNTITCAIRSVDDTIVVMEKIREVVGD